MAKNKTNKNQYNSYRPNFWGMIQNILITSINKGQLLGAAVAIILIILVLKYPSDEIPELVDKLLNISEFNSVLGWVVSGISTLGGFLITRWQRRIHTKEIKRISQEKKALQAKLTEKKLPSSNN